MLWLAVPAVLVVGALGCLAGVASIDRGRRQLQRQVAALVEVRAALPPVQARIEAARAIATAHVRR